MSEDLGSIHDLLGGGKGAMRILQIYKKEYFTWVAPSNLRCFSVTPHPPPPAKKKYRVSVETQFCAPPLKNFLHSKTYLFPLSHKKSTEGEGKIIH